MPSPVTDYIHQNWHRSIYRDANGSGFRGIDLPFPYTSPCIKGEGHFHFFFYWDTYFTNLGLLRSGLADTARDNIRNILWFIRRQGYMPNHVGLFNRSQPPYLCSMVADYFDHLGGSEAKADRLAPAEMDFFRECCEVLRQEYHFWTTARHTPTGLQRHGQHDTEEGCIAFYNEFLINRLGKPKDAPLDEKYTVGAHYLAEAESGWDFTPRFSGRCLDHNPADLNSLLYTYETFLGSHSAALGWDDAPLWQERAAARRERMTRLLWSEAEGWFMDYDFVNRCHGPVPSLGGILALFSGLATQEQAARMVAKLPEFERAHGIAVTTDHPSAKGYQWAYPNVWPPLVWVTVAGLRRYGFHADATRIARKYLATSDALFARTGQLWEKTDALTGDVARGEYQAAPMLGWSAGVYLACADVLASTREPKLTNKANS
jgi:alpha,alpha-trehalase